MTSSALRAAGAGLLFAAALAFVPSRATLPPSDRRPLVLMLPGRGYLAQDTMALRRDWWAALDRGLAAAGASGLVPEADFHLVWYADVLDPTARATCRDDHLRRGAPVRAAQEVASGLATALAATAQVADWSELLDGGPMRAVAGDLLYLGDDRKRCAAEERLSDALVEATRSDRPVVLVTHSFGALVAHGYLSNRSEDRAPPVESWITIGSLVGWPELRELLLGSTGRELGLPDAVDSWTNVYDPKDVLGSPLFGLTDEARDSDAVRDEPTESTPVGDPHDPVRYFSDPVTTRALLEAWCGASDAPACAAAARAR